MPLASEVFSPATTGAGGMLLLVPSDWSWERDAVGFYNWHHLLFCAAAIAYYPTIFGLQAFMRTRDPVRLGGGGGSASSGSVNWILWWELPLALFSILGAYHVVPMALEPVLRGGGWAAAICGPGVHDDPRSVWTFFFVVSKVVEFGDTLFVVLRKKPLILLQYYHHLASMLYCWYGTLIVYRLNNTNVYFTAMNLAVHSVMYSWYAATRTGWRSPKLLMMLVTLLQLVQMVAGVLIVLVAAFGDPASGCGRWADAEHLMGMRACLFMYFSYLVLFALLFYDNYLAKKKPHKAKTG